MSVNRLRLHVLMLATSMVIASACSALTPDDPAATLRAEREGYVAEATVIASNEIAQQTQVADSVIAAETRVREVEARNALLLATLQVVVPPTQQIVNSSGEVTPGLLATPAPPGSVIVNSGTPNPNGGGVVGTSFVEIATASSVRDSDGCADNIQNAFASDVQRIYVTARAFNINAGTTMRVEWFYEGTSSFTESFTVDVSDDDFCLWFYIEPTEVAFSPGAWTVQLYANEQPVQPTAAFTIGM